MDIAHDPRGPLTTEALIDRHGPTYQQLMARCSVVVSVPLCITLVGHKTFHERDSNINIRLPRRMWVGLEHRSASELTLGSIQEYDAVHDSFGSSAAVLRERLNQLLSSGLLRGVTGALHVLCETQDGRGMAVSGSLAAALALLQRTASGEVTPQLLVDWSARSTLELMSTPLFSELIAIAWRGQQFLRPGKFGGSGAINALGNGQVLWCTNTQDRTHVLTPMDFGMQSPPSEWTVDIAILSSGSRDDLGLAHQAAVHDGELADFLGRMAEHLPGDSKFLAPLEQTSEEFIASLHDRTTLEIFQRWQEYWAQQGGHEALERLIETFRRRGHLLQALEHLHPRVSQAIEQLHTTLHGQRFGAVPVTTGSHGGSVLIIAPAAEVRTKLHDVVTRMVAAGADEACFEYLSWRDSGSAPGPRIEQHAAHDHYSGLLPAMKDRTSLYTRDGVVHDLADDMQQLEDAADIVLDGVNERVLIAGKPVSSKELPSQRMTIDLLRMLLRSDARTIPNTALPNSAYRSSRSELTSKLVAPLLRTLEKRSGKLIDVRTRGSISAFTIALDLKDVKVLVVEKMHGSR